MNIQVASWNLEGRLTGYKKSGRGSAEHILRGIKQLDADILVLPDAFLENVAPGVDEYLRKLGYVWHDLLYDDQDRNWSYGYLGKVSGMRILSRFEIIEIDEIWWGIGPRRMVVVVKLPNGNKLRVVGVHLDDRAEVHRESQVRELVKYLDRVEALPTVVAGDFNAVHGGDLRAKLLGSKFFRWIAHHIPSRLTPPPGDFADDIHGFAMRGTDMMSGRALKLLEQKTNLRDLDPRHKATATIKLRSLAWLPSLRVMQLDHLFASSEIKAGFVRVWQDGGSDHRAVSATIRL